ncbi:MAG: hypothetical protein ACI915_002265 [Gammaproteobacteria bacterium]|jgi:hypothetical protein
MLADKLPDNLGGSRTKDDLRGDCSYVALDFRSRLGSASPVHGVVSPASPQSYGKAGFDHFRYTLALNGRAIRP